MLIEMFLEVANNKDKEWFARSCINRALGNSMQIQKRDRYSHSRNLGGEAAHQQEVNDRFVFGDTGDEPRKDNQRELERWCNVINLIPSFLPLGGLKDLVKEQRVYLTQLNENPQHSEHTILEWSKELSGQFETDELARKYAIAMLDQQTKNSLSDWTTFGEGVELDVITQLQVTPTHDYPENLGDVVKARVEKMIEFLDRRPNIRALGKRFELVQMLKS